MSQLTPTSRTQLREALVEHFSLDELDTLCYDLGVDYESVPGYGRDKETRAREIVTYFEDRGRLADLAAQCAKERPLIRWADLLRFAAEAPDDDPTSAPSAGEAAATPSAPPVAVPVSQPRTMPSAVLNMSRTAAHSIMPRLLVDGADVLHLTWLDDTLRQGQTGLFKYDVLHRQLPPDGQWSDVTNLTEGFRSVTDYHLALLRDSAGAPCVIWQGDASHDNVDGFYLRRLGGGQWSAPERVAEGSFGVLMTSAFAPDGTLVTIQGYPPDYHPTFGETDLSDGLKAASDIQVAVDTAGTYHVVWVRQGEPYSVEYRASTDGGQTWLPSSRLSTDDTAPTTPWLRLVADTTGAVHLVWAVLHDNAYYRRWTPSDGWEATVNLGRFGVPNYVEDLVVDAAGRPHGIWMSSIDEHSYAYQQPNGAWSSRLITASGMNPTLALDGQGHAHIAWEAQDDAQDIHYVCVM